jgi:cation diffusion facilitator CzcD-associated flavoprotein CzcO
MFLEETTLCAGLPDSTAMSTLLDVAIIGAWPYGLSATAHLRAAGVDARIFGPTMDFWERQMPAGMLLRSSWDACHISDPEQGLRLDDYQAETKAQFRRPVPLDDFLGYGKWFQRRTAPDLDTRRVELVELVRGGFRLKLERGERITARRVVIATGIAPFAYVPEEFNGLSSTLASHSSWHSDVTRWKGARLIVIGASQSAVEYAALLAEIGAEVELIARTSGIRWLNRSSRLHRLPGGVRRLLYHPTDVGPALLSQLIAHPDLFRWLPKKSQDMLAYRAIRPAASSWLRLRLGEVRFTYGSRTVSATARGEQVLLRLNDGSSREADHVILATGYRVDISRCSFLPATQRGSVRTRNGYPELGPGLESSHPGLHFAGALAAYSFGPLMRFVSGTHYASAALTRRIVGVVPSTPASEAA